MRRDVSSVTLFVAAHRVERSVLRDTVIVHMVLVLEHRVVIRLAPTVALRARVDSRMDDHICVAAL